MTIQLSAEQSQMIDRAIQAGIIREAADAVEVGIQTIRLQLNAQTSLSSKLSAEDWMEDFHAWIDSHPTDSPLLSDEAISRESIYSDRLDTQR